MVFSSLIFLFLFLPLTLVLYMFSPTINAKNNVLVIMSVIFYAWGEPIYVLLMMAYAFVNYFCGLMIGNSREQGQKKFWMILGVTAGLLFLGYFKYFGWLIESLNAVTGLAISVPQVTMPIGISFFTFQTMTYTIDVYRGEVKVQRSYRNLLLYVSLFPQLIAGPIVRYADVEREISNRKITRKKCFKGLHRFSIGMGKKILIANYCGAIADKMLGGDLSQGTVVGVWLGVLMYTLQIYFDFAGYSDMAIGLGKIFGFNFLENFDLPYMSKSITEFWRRWHMSLGTFFRDYVYIPLGGNRKHQTFNMFVVWSLTGLWHGASWNFVLWGMYFFVLLFVEKKYMKRLEQLPAAVRHLITMILVVFGWVLFYCVDMGQLWKVLGCMFGLYGAGFSDYSTGITLTNNIPLLLLGIVASTALPRTIGNIVKSFCMRKDSHPIAKRGYVIAVGLMDWAILFLCLISLIGSSYNPFLYFRF